MVGLSLLSLVFLATTTFGAPAVSESASVVVTESVAATSTVAAAAASVDPNFPLWNADSDPAIVQPIRGDLGAPVMGPDNIPIDLQNPDLLASPSTDRGSVYVHLLALFLQS